MGATTLRLSDDKLRLIRAIAGYENRPLSKIFDELVSEYIERHRETLELIGIPNFINECKNGLKDVKEGGGKDLDKLEG
jgi:predicted transcriptional regulator